MARKARKQWDERQATKAAERRAHFANGGTLATWRGRPARFQDAKKVTSKAACRGHFLQEG